MEPISNLSEKGLRPLTISSDKSFTFVKSSEFVMTGQQTSQWTFGTTKVSLNFLLTNLWALSSC